MSAFQYLKFVIGVVLMAAFGAVLNEAISPTLDLASSQSTSAEAATGVQWFQQFWNWAPLVILLLLVFMLVVGIVRRRNQVGIR